MENSIILEYWKYLKNINVSIIFLKIISCHYVKLKQEIEQTVWYLYNI